MSLVWTFLGVVVGFACGYALGYQSAEIDEFRRRYLRKGGHNDR